MLLVDMSIPFVFEITVELDNEILLFTLIHSFSSALNPSGHCSKQFKSSPELE